MINIDEIIFNQHNITSDILLTKYYLDSNNTLWFALILHLTHPTHTILPLMFLHPSLPHKPRVNPASYAVSCDWLEPHESDTKEAGDERRIHRSDDEGATCDIFTSCHEDIWYGLHLRSLHRWYVHAEEEDAVEGETREKESDTPCKSLLDSSYPDFFSFLEIHTHECAEDAPFWTEKDLRHELKYHQAHEYEWDRVLGLKEHEKKWCECEEEHDACRDADFAFIDETVFVMFFREAFYEVSVHRIE